MPELLRGNFTTQTDFLKACGEFDDGGIPAGHTSKLAPLFVHPAGQPIPYDVLFHQLADAIEGTEGVKGEAGAPPIGCLLDPLHAPPRPPHKLKIGEHSFWGEERGV